MRIAVVSDVHGNLTALEAVIADLRTVAPDLIVHGGDLVANGSSPAAVFDRIRDLGWPGVVGNTDEMLWKPERLADLAERVPSLRQLFETMRLDIVPATCGALGEDRLAWLRGLPEQWSEHSLTVLHAGPGDVWRGPMPEASDDELVGTYRSLGTSRVVYGHIHRPFVRATVGLIVANSGAVSLSYDGDRRASYAIVDDNEISIRRVAYDVEREIASLHATGHPQADWLATMLRAGNYVAPKSAPN